MHSFCIRFTLFLINHTGKSFNSELKSGHSLLKCTRKTCRRVETCRLTFLVSLSPFCHGSGGGATPGAGVLAVTRRHQGAEGPVGAHRNLYALTQQAGLGEGVGLPSGRYGRAQSSPVTDKKNRILRTWGHGHDKILAQPTSVLDQV